MCPPVPTPSRPRTFPDGFLFGTKTSAYQIEGAVNDDGRGPSIWDTYSHAAGNVWNGDTGDIACDHFHRMDEDLDLMKKLGVWSHRFSPSRGLASSPTARVRRTSRASTFIVDSSTVSNRATSKPTLTLYHWDLPQALEDNGGWTVRDTAERFAEYVDLVARSLGSDVPIAGSP